MAIVQNLPEISQLSTIREDVEYAFDDTQDVYSVTKGPALRVFKISSGNKVFAEGTDYDLVLNANGDIRAIDWSIGGDNPSDGSTFTVDQEFESILSRLLDEHDTAFDRLSDDLDEVVQIRQIENASGSELDRLGAIFGELGKRRGRNDDDYEVYLSGIVDSFNGRGTKSGLRFAIASAIGTDVENIVIEEDFENLEYTVQIQNVDAEFLSSSINDLAELADPSAVKLAEAIIVTEGDDIFVTESDSSISESTIGLGGGTLTLDGNSTLG